VGKNDGWGAQESHLINNAGAGAEQALSGERTAECLQRQLKIKTNPVTGARYYEETGKPRFLQVIPAQNGEPAFNANPEISLKYPVPGLRAFNRGGIWMRWEWVTDEGKDAADAVDAQCRAGWDDYAYGFYEFKWQPKRDGKFVCTWECEVHLHD
jgi:hypothetical protein